MAQFTAGQLIEGRPFGCDPVKVVTGRVSSRGEILIKWPSNHGSWVNAVALAAQVQA